MTRQIALDTETTGIGPGHKIIEIGCIEIHNRVVTGERFHVYLNPERNVDEGAFRVHGLSDEFLQDKPYFMDIKADFLAFVDGSELIIHNAAFDTGFLNYELACVQHPHTIQHHCQVTDSLQFARKKHPGQRNSLDALCKRYDIDNSGRSLHGALLDAELLAEMWLAMTGGQAVLFAENEETAQDTVALQITAPLGRKPDTRVILPDAEELELHAQFMELLKK